RHRLHGLFVEPHTQRPDHVNLMREAVGTNLGSDNNNALVMRFAGFVRVFRLEHEYDLWPAVELRPDGSPVYRSGVACAGPRRVSHPATSVIANAGRPRPPESGPSTPQGLPIRSARTSGIGMSG